MAEPFHGGFEAPVLAHRTVRQGDNIPPPASTTSISTIEDGPAVIDAYRKRHETGLRGVAGFSNERLSTEFTFVGRRFTVMGLLWMVLADPVHGLCASSSLTM